MGKVSSILEKIFVVIMALITLFPFVYMILSSLMTFQEATSVPPTLFPKSFQWQNFREAMKQAPFARYFLNTIFVAGISTLGTLITSVLAAFALVKLESVSYTHLSAIISGVIPTGNVLVGVIAYCVGMAVFTAIMGNAFAAFSVITVGVGLPFVFAQGGDPVSYTHLFIYQIEIFITS